MNVLAIDQGTSSTKALVISDDWQVIGAGACPVTISATGDGAIEGSASELLESILMAGHQAIADSGVTIDAIGLANQGETVVAWDPASGEPVSPAISWQDRRAAGITAAMSADAKRLAEITGLPLDPYFTAPKLRWLRNQVGQGPSIGGIDSWLNLSLTGRAITDPATASRSMLLDLDSRTWSSEATAIFGLDVEGLAEIVDSAGALGETSAFGAPIAVTALAVDQQAALIGEGCLRPGQAKCTYGTGAFLLMTTGSEPIRSANGLSASVAWQTTDDHAYCLDGQAYTAGSAISWLSSLGLIKGPAELDELARSANRWSRTLCVPALAGLGAPHWDPAAQASFEGISLQTGRPEIVKAVLEGLAAQVAVLARAAVADLGRPLSSLKVDGGLTGSAVLMQLQADLLQVPVEVFSSPDATALGMASLARFGAGLSRSLAPPPTLIARRFEPMISADEATERLARWESAAQRAMAAARHGESG